jgi:hypothetical protein
MRKIIFTGSAKTVGTNFAEAELYPAEATNAQLDEDAFQYSVQNAEMYGWEYVGDDCILDDDEYENYVTDSELSYQWEEYDPEKHDMLRIGGGSFEDDFALQMNNV